MPDKPTLYVCSVDQGGFKQHPCRYTHEALTTAGLDHDKIVFAKAHPFGLFTRGRRPQLKAMSGQEKLPVLRLPDDSVIVGGKNIVAWAETNASAS